MFPQRFMQADAAQRRNKRIILLSVTATCTSRATSMRGMSGKPLNDQKRQREMKSACHCLLPSPPRSPARSLPDSLALTLSCSLPPHPPLFPAPPDRRKEAAGTCFGSAPSPSSLQVPSEGPALHSPRRRRRRRLWCFSSAKIFEPPCPTGFTLCQPREKEMLAE